MIPFHQVEQSQVQVLVHSQAMTLCHTYTYMDIVYYTVEHKKYNVQYIYIHMNTYIVSQMSFSVCMTLDPHIWFYHMFPPWPRERINAKLAIPATTNPRANARRSAVRAQTFWDGNCLRFVWSFSWASF